ncbi:glycosyltransferase family 2 protein [Sulfuriroseicoccus oceanibius]|uniref:Glycosyltransferase family 2 protein n=2 Tax=Sulfuriroseicoccus oceanibius TaxID=2707525 RepID=A0A6B3L5I2_9BACT|nr:glycosyltransferase family 2 protein [Sulfuriroseicoccus oceanibius]
MKQPPVTEDSVGILSIVMPAYNEAATIAEVVDAVLVRGEVGELVIVDDCSSDGTWDEIQRIANERERVRVFRHDVNQGKGAALRTGISHCTKPYVLIQDADMEYWPGDYAALVRPLLDNGADVVYGSRFLTGNAHCVLAFWHSMGNQFLTMMSNMFSNLHLTDMETCYKAFRREIIQSIDICENRFGFEPEITAKMAAMRAKIYEVGISYQGRSYEEGKKIGWRDGVRAIYCILKYNLWEHRPLSMPKPVVTAERPAVEVAAEGA